MTEVQLLYGERLRHRQRMCQRGQRHKTPSDRPAVCFQADGPSALGGPSACCWTAAIHQPIRTIDRLWLHQIGFGGTVNVVGRLLSKCHCCYQHNCCSNTTIPTALPPAPMPAGMEEEGEVCSSLKT